MSNLFTSAIKDDPEAQARVRTWIAALRSGAYEQARSRLVRDDSDTRRFCCLGVACDLHDSTLWETRPVEYPTYLGEDTHLPDSVAWSLRLTDSSGWYVGGDHSDLVRYLASDNDGGESFTEIADTIERELAEVLV